MFPVDHNVLPSFTIFQASTLAIGGSWGKDCHDDIVSPGKI